MSKKISDIVWRIKDLEKLARNYSGVTDREQINILVSSYLRDATNRYNDWRWRLVLTKPNESFKIYVSKLDPSIASDLNISVVDPDNTEIDLIHLLATIEGYEYPHGLPIPDSYFGWAGDLASQAPNLKSEMQRSGVTLNLGNARQYASLTGEANVEDIHTDIDAAVICKKTLNSSTYLSEAIAKYYLDYSKNRYKLFINTFGDEYAMRNTVTRIMRGDGDIRGFGLHELGGGPVDTFYYEALGHKFSDFVVNMSN